MRYELMLPHQIRDAINRNLPCATMIGLHIEASLTIFRFHRWRAPQIAGSVILPIRLCADREVVALAESHCATLGQAAVLAAEHPEFGFHQEPGAALYTADTIALAITETRCWLNPEATRTV